MFKIWGRPTSVNVQRVLWAAAETGHPFERIDAGGAFGGLDDLSFLAKNPNGAIPVLEDGDVAVWESNGIVRYLAARYAAGLLWDEDPVRRSLADRWMDWTIAEQQLAMTPAFIALVRTPEDNRDPAVIEASRAKTEKLMAVLDRHLSGTEYLAGEHFGMADLTLGPGIHRWYQMPLAARSWQHVERWYAAIAARPTASVALPSGLA